jgi:hypothetical protein
MKNLFLFIAGAAVGAGGLYVYHISQKPKAISITPGSNIPNGSGVIINSSPAQAPSGPNFGRSVTGKPNYGMKKRKIQLPHIF